MNKLANDLHKVLNLKATAAVMKEHYSHVKLPFTKKEVEDFLADEPGKIIDRSLRYTRSNQVSQAISCIGGFLVDRKKADAETKRVYKAVWAVEIEAKCPCCKRKYANKLMFKAPTCGRPRCQLNHMRDSI